MAQQSLDHALFGTRKVDKLKAKKNGSYYFNGRQSDDRIDGGKNGDYVIGGGGNDNLKGKGGKDIFEADLDDDNINGGSGKDTVIFKGNFSDYKISKSGGNWKTKAKNKKTDKLLKEGKDVLKSI